MKKIKTLAEEGGFKVKQGMEDVFETAALFLIESRYPHSAFAISLRKGFFDGNPMKWEDVSKIMPRFIRNDKYKGKTIGLSESRTKLIYDRGIMVLSWPTNRIRLSKLCDMIDP